MFQSSALPLIILSGCSATLLNYNSPLTSTNETGSFLEETATTETASIQTGDPLFGGYISFSLTQISCPNCFGLTNNIEVYAESALIAPTGSAWLDWMPPTGSCSSTALPPTPTGPFTDLGDWIYLETDAGSVPLRQVSRGSVLNYQSTGLTEADFLRSTSYDLSVPDGGSLGPFTVSDVLTTPQGFDTITPTNLLLVNPSSAFSATISLSGTAVGWTPYGGSNAMIIRIDEYAASGAYLRSALCRGPDNGSLTVPASAMTGMQAGNQVAVYIMRTNVGQAINPVNGSIIEHDVSMRVVGTGILRP